MKLVDHGSIRNNLPKLYEMSFKDKLRSLFRIARGLYQIHKAELVHRDFHSGNILLSSTDAIYVTDLGLCKPMHEYTSSETENRKVYGVLPYVAPEVLRGEEYTEKADVYAFGIIMSEVLSGIPPFSKVPHDKDLAINICNGLRPKISSNIPPLMIDLMQNCWDSEPLKRLSAYELCCILDAWNYYKDYPNSEFTKQVSESESKPSGTFQKIETHPSAIYTSRFLDFENLPKPKNSEPIQGK